MSRSTYIYVVMKHGEPEAAFTVKHELRSWLERFPEVEYNNIWRLSDGDHRPPTVIADV